MADVSGVLFVAPAQGFIAYVSGVVQPNPGRGILVDCTGAGNATFTAGDGTSITVNLASGTLYQFNWAIVTYTAGTATCTVTLLK